MSNDLKTLLALLRADLYAFIVKVFETLHGEGVYVSNWHIEVIAWELTKCVRHDGNRLIIALPPRYLKSLCASVAFPCWILGHFPSAQIICVSYSEDLALLFSRQRRQIMEAKWYRDTFRRTRFYQVQAVVRLICESKSSYASCSNMQRDMIRMQY